MHEIGSYISKELLEPETARKVVAKIANSINALEDMPLRNPIVMDNGLASIGIRKIVVDNYIVFYIVSVKSKTVTVIRILNSRRDWLNLL